MNPHPSEQTEATLGIMGLVVLQASPCCIDRYTHSLASLQWLGLSDQQMLLLTENYLQPQKWSRYKGRGAVVLKRRDMAQTKVFLQPTKRTFPLLQNLYSKWIVPTDNMWQNLHYEYTHHQWLYRSRDDSWSCKKVVQGAGN